YAADGFSRASILGSVRKPLDFANSVERIRVKDVLVDYSRRDARMARHRLTDEQWALIEQLFPALARTGRPPANRRTTFEGILWILTTGAPWRDLPEEFGAWTTVWGWFRKWSH